MQWALIAQKAGKPKREKKRENSVRRSQQFEAEQRNLSGMMVFFLVSLLQTPNSPTILLEHSTIPLQFPSFFFVVSLA
jgi:hypothetical protein